MWGGTAWSRRPKNSVGSGTPSYSGIYVWGAGRHTRQRAAHLETHGVRLAGYVDVDPKKTGRGIGGTGRPVLAPVDLPPPGPIFVLVYVSTRGAPAYNRASWSGAATWKDGIS